MQAADVGPMSVDEPSNVKVEPSSVKVEPNSVKVEQDNENKLPDGPAVMHQKPSACSETDKGFVS